MIDRRTLLGWIALGCSFAADGEAQPKAARIGILSPPEPFTAAGVFQRGLQELGYGDASGTRIEYRSSEGSEDRWPALAAELVRLKVDVIIAITPPAIRAAQAATTTIPIVMLLSGDPVRSGLVRSLARPGGNTTGPATLTVDLAPKQLQIFKEAVPSLREVAILVNPIYPRVRQVLAQMEAAGPKLGLRVRILEVREPPEVDRALAELGRARPDGLFVMASPLTSASMDKIVEFVTAHRLPGIDPRRQFPERGGLMSYGIDYAEHVRIGLRYVDRILRGAKPGDLPVEQPTKFELVINLRTARTLGVAIPQALLLRVDQVIQ